MFWSVTHWTCLIRYFHDHYFVYYYLCEPSEFTNTYMHNWIQGLPIPQHQSVTTRKIYNHWSSLSVKEWTLISLLCCWCRADASSSCELVIAVIMLCLQDSVSRHFPIWSVLYSLLFFIWGSLCLDLIEGGKTSWSQDKWTLKLSTTKITVTENQNGYQVKGPKWERRAKAGGKLKWVTAKKHISILAKSGPTTRNYLI